MRESATFRGMQRYTAHVQDGRIVLDDPKADLPEGTEVEVVLVDANDTMTDEERLALDAELEAACDEADQGHTEEASVVFAEMEALIAARMLKAPA